MILAWPLRDFLLAYLNHEREEALKAYELGIMLYTIKIAPHIDVKSLKGVKAPSLPKILSEKHGNPK